MLTSFRCGIALAAGALLVPLPAAAHHTMEGAAPATAWEGLASGFAHPVIGLDHLAFLLATGAIAAAAPRRGGTLSLAFLLGCGLAGAALRIARWGSGPVEAVVALSVLAAGLVLVMPISGLSSSARLSLALAFASAGTFHGYAYAEAVEGSPAITIAAYLLALTVSQLAVAGPAILLARRLWSAPTGAPRLQQRLAGLAVAAVGAVFLATALLA